MFYVARTRVLLARGEIQGVHLGMPELLWGADHLGMRSVLHTDRAGFNSLAPYEDVSLAQWQCGRFISD